MRKDITHRPHRRGTDAETEVAVLTMHPLIRKDADRILPYSDQVVQVNSKRDALARIHSAAGPAHGAFSHRNVVHFED